MALQRPANGTTTAFVDRRTSKKKKVRQQPVTVAAVDMFPQ
jgi:hypothetical protein